MIRSLTATTVPIFVEIGRPLRYLHHIWYGDRHGPAATSLASNSTSDKIQDGGRRDFENSL